MIKHALSYAENGFAVFPCYTMLNGICSCGRKKCDRLAKHPMIPNGRSGATIDPDVVREWWYKWPKANIAIATGKESGIIVLDVDEGGEESLLPYDLPTTVEVVTGGGGRHLIYKRPDSNLKYKTMTSILTGVDVRADGGYIIAPPSIHQSGRNYEWEASHHPEDVLVADCPKWLIEMIVEEEIDRVPLKWIPDGLLPDDIEEILSYIPADDYQTWMQVGMALHYESPDSGFAIFDQWSRSSKKYNADSVSKQWAVMSKRNHNVNHPITIQTIKALATKHGWNDPDEMIGHSIACSLIEGQNEQALARVRNKKENVVITIPENYLPEHGLLREIIDYILITSVRPQPLLAVGAACSFVGALIGRKYRSETDLRSNVYFVCLSKSGSGKGNSIASIDRLAFMADVDRHIGGSAIASGPGVIKALVREPSTLFMIDEFGIFLKSITGRADNHRAEIMNNFMQLFSKASGIWRGTEYGTKEKERNQIVSPNLCLFGVSTHERFFESLSSTNGVDGSLARMIVIDSADGPKPIRQSPSLDPPSVELLEKIANIAVHPNGDQNLNPEPKTIYYADGVRKLTEELDMTMDILGERSNTQGSIYSRVTENTIKLALIHSVSCGYDEITKESFEWAMEFVLWCANKLVYQLDRHMADNETEKSLKTVYNIIRDSGEDGIEWYMLLRKTNGIRTRDLTDIITGLHAREQIVIIEKNIGKSEKPKRVFIAT